jgi:hypothetical protein
MSRLEFLQTFLELIAKADIFTDSSIKATCFKIFYGVPVEIVREVVVGYFDEYYRRALYVGGNYHWLESVFRGPHSWHCNWPDDRVETLASAAIAFRFGAYFGTTPLYAASNFTFCLNELILAQCTAVWAADDPEAAALENSPIDSEAAVEGIAATAKRLESREWFRNVAAIAVARREWTAVANRISEAKLQFIPLESPSQMEADLGEWLDVNNNGWCGMFTFPPSYNTDPGSLHQESNST